MKVRADESAMHEGPQHVHGGAERGARQHQLCVCVCNVRSWRSQHTSQPMAEKKKDRSSAMYCISTGWDDMRAAPATWRWPAPRADRCIWS